MDLFTNIMSSPTRPSPAPNNESLRLPRQRTQQMRPPSKIPMTPGKNLQSLSDAESNARTAIPQPSTLLNSMSLKHKPSGCPYHAKPTQLPSIDWLTLVNSQYLSRPRSERPSPNAQTNQTARTSPLQVSVPLTQVSKPQSPADSAMLRLALQDRQDRLLPHQETYLAHRLRVVSGQEQGAHLFKALDLSQRCLSRKEVA